MAQTIILGFFPQTDEEFWLKAFNKIKLKAKKKHKVLQPQKIRVQQSYKQLNTAPLKNFLALPIIYGSKR